MVNLLRGVGRRWLLVITAIALIFLSLSVVSCRQLSDDIPSFNERTRLLAFVPKYALIAASADTEFLSNKKPRKADILTKIAPQIKPSLLEPLSLELAEDILPWLGNRIAFAITAQDLNRNLHNGHRVGYLLVMDAVDGDRLRECLELFWQRQTVAGNQPTLTQVNGVPIISGLIAQQQRSLATAIVGRDILLVANDVQVLRQSLQVAQVPSLQLSPQLVKQDAQTLWINLRIPEFVNWLGLALPSQPSLLSMPQWQQLTASFETYPHRVDIKTRLTSPYTPHQLRLEATVDDSVETLVSTSANFDQYLPASIAWAAVGHDLSIPYTSLQHELERYEALPFLWQRAQQWLSNEPAQTLLDPITQLLAGDYAIGQFANGDWLVAITDEYQTTLNILDDLVERQGVTVSPLTIGEQTVTAWSRLTTLVGKDNGRRETAVATDIVALHTTIENCHIFATSIEALTLALRSGEPSLSETIQFKQAVKSLGTSKQGYVYGTWSETERLLASNRWFSLVQPILQPWSQSIDAIAITSYGKANDQSTGAVSILLKK